jgi:hypothetical protein
MRNSERIFTVTLESTMVRRVVRATITVRADTAEQAQRYVHHWARSGILAATEVTEVMDANNGPQPLVSMS